MRPPSSPQELFYPDLPKIQIRSSTSRSPSTASSRSNWREDERRSHHPLHMEEDAGKSMHEGFPDSNEKSYIDLNRSACADRDLSEPDMPRRRSPRISHPHQGDHPVHRRERREHGESSLRCDANISLRPRGQEKFAPSGSEERERFRSSSSPGVRDRAPAGF